MNEGLLASQAAVAMLTGADPALSGVTNFYAEIEDPNDGENNTANQREHPCVVIWLSAAQEFPPFTGNYSADLNIMVEASADDHTAEEFSDMYSEVRAIFATNELAADLSAFDGFHCFGLTGGIKQSAQTTENRQRKRTLVLPINFCASNIAAS